MFDADQATAMDEMKRQKSKMNAAKREFNTEMLQKFGVKFDSKNGGKHLVITHFIPNHGTVVVDFWPSTELWHDRDDTSSYKKGIATLLTYLGVNQHG